MEFGWGEEWDLSYPISDFIYKARVLRGCIQHKVSVKPTEHTGEPRNRHTMETGFMTECAVPIRRKDT